MKGIGLNPIARSVLFAKLIDDIENEFIEHIKDAYGVNVLDMPTDCKDWCCDCRSPQHILECRRFKPKEEENEIDRC